MRSTVSLNSTSPCFGSPTKSPSCATAMLVCSMSAPIATKRVGRNVFAIRIVSSSSIGSAGRLRNDVDQRRLTGPDALQSPPNRRRELVGISDRTFGIDAVASRHRSVVDVRILDRGADISSIRAPAPLRAHALHEHDLAVITAIVVDHDEQRNLMMRGGPENARRVIEIT